MKNFTFFLLLLLVSAETCLGGKEEEEGVKFANKCEVCKILTIELEDRLEKTGKSQDIIEIGYSLDDTGREKKRTKYRKSELRLVESLDGICEEVLKYNIHKERTDSTRFAKGMSQTFRTLHGLVNKGVKVELGIPEELWDKPSVEITNMKTQCEQLLEEHESDIEEWYFKSEGEVPLQTFLCSQLVLRDEDDSCLNELESNHLEAPHNLKEKKLKGDVKNKDEL